MVLMISPAIVVLMEVLFVVLLLRVVLLLVVLLVVVLPIVIMLVAVLFVVVLIVVVLIVMGVLIVVVKVTRSELPNGNFVMSTSGHVSGPRVGCIVSVQSTRPIFFPKTVLPSVLVCDVM